MRKRFLSALLALCMALTLLPGTALAAEEADVERGYFGEQLEGYAQQIYDELCKASDSAEIKNGEPIVVMRKTSENLTTSNAALAWIEEQEDILDAAKDVYSDALAAFDRDCSDVFWIGNNFEASTYTLHNGQPVQTDDEGRYNVYPGTYTLGLQIVLAPAADWNSQTLQDAITKVESTVAKLAADAKKESASVSEQLRYVHDWLTQHNVYNSAAADAGSGAMKAPWKAISALDESLSPVCEGYSRAFQLVCDELGVPCILVSGTGENDGESEDHMWNYVQLGNGWYAVDVTWDDPVKADGTDGGPTATDYTYFLKGSSNFPDHTATSNDFMGGQTVTFKYPELNTADYVPPKDISGATVTVASVTYTGEEITPMVTVTVDGVSLNVGTDCDVLYSNNVNAGDTAKVTVIGKGGYTGTVEKPFTIAPKALTPAMVTGLAESYSHTGSAITPEVTVKDGETTLVKDTDYTADYSNNIEVGTAKVTVTGKGNYCDKVDNNFEITEAATEKKEIRDTDVTLEYTSATHTGTALEPVVTVTVDGTTLTKGTDYTVTYDNNVNVGTATVTVTGMDKYDGTVRKTFTITPKPDDPNPPVDPDKTTLTDANVALEYTTAVYTGSEIQPKVTVTVGDTTLEKDTDYTVVYSNNVNVGKATVTVTGMDKYDGTVSKNFEITEVPPVIKEITDGDVTVTPATMTYTGSALKPAVTVRVDGVTLVENTDYTVAYSDNVNVGTATVTVTGMGSYTGTAVKNFTIEKATYTADAEDITVEIGEKPAITGTASVKGEWSFVDGTPDTSKHGSNEIKVRFTPDDAAYDPVERTIRLNVTYPVLVTPDDADNASGVVSASDNKYNPTENRYEMTLRVSYNFSMVNFLSQMFRTTDADVDVYDATGRHLLGTWDCSEKRFSVSDNVLTESAYVLRSASNNKEDQYIKLTTDEDEDFYITVSSSKGGEVVPSARRAEPGQRVSLYVTADKDYELDTLTVKDSRGRTITCRSLGGDAYYFYMPSAPVTVEADFVKTADKDDDADVTPGSTSDPDSVYNQPFTGLGTPGISGIVLNPASMPFTDVKGPNWYYNYVEYVWKHYLMSGTSDTRFDPNVTTSRAMIWTILARMNNVRTDINPGSTWFEKGMLWAMEKGITDGSNAMGNITREQLATMLWRNAGSPAAGGDLSRFSDSADVSDYAAAAVRWAASNGILSGINGRIEPQGTATRAQVAAMVARYGDKLVR